MSGGSYEYAYEKVDRFAEALERGERFDGVTTDAPNCLVRLGFAAHLRKVAAAMKAIEWEDSYDCSPPHAINAIHAVTGDHRPCSPRDASRSLLHWHGQGKLAEPVS
jgi:hypothetical protein